MKTTCVFSMQGGAAREKRKGKQRKGKAGDSGLSGFSGTLGTTWGLAAAVCVGFCHVRRGREAGHPGLSGTLGTTWGLAAAVCVGLAGGLLLKSNNPNLSGGILAKGPNHLQV